MQNITQYTNAILNYFGKAKKIGNQYVCLCPLHHDTEPSLFVKPVGNKLLFHCFVCGDNISREIFKILIEAGIIEGGNKTKTKKPKLTTVGKINNNNKKINIPENLKIKKIKNSEIAGIFEYKNKTGKTYGYVVRYNLNEGGKTFLQYFKYENGKYHCGGVREITRYPYCINKLNKQRQIWLFEGEAKADLFNQLVNLNEAVGLSYGGANGWKKLNWDDVINSNAEIVIWGDADGVGQKTANELASFFKNNQTFIVDIKQTGLTGKQDIIDFINNGKSLTDVFIKKIETETEKKLTFLQEKYSEKTLANLVLEEIKNKIILVEGYGSFYYNKKFWQQDISLLNLKSFIKNNLSKIAKKIPLETETEAEKKIKTKTIITCGSKRKIEAVTALVRRDKNCYKTINKMNNNSDYLLNVNNGVIDLKKRKLLEHKPEFYLTNIANVDYRPRKKAKLWKGFLNEIFLGDEELVKFIQTAVGYSLSGDTSEQVIFFLIGNGANGKSVFCETIREILGTYAAVVNTEIIATAKHSNNNNIQTQLARIANKRLVFGNEIPPNAYLAEAKLKEIAGCDKMVARFLFQQEFEFLPKFKLWIRSNERPKVRGTDLGIWRRLILIPFDYTVPKEKRDKHIQEKLLLEREGILNWAIEGFREWQKNGLTVEHPKLKMTIDEYKEEQDSVERFLQECCFRDPALEISTNELYTAFCSWCEEQGEYKKSKTFLTRQLKKKNIKIRKSAYSKYYVGLNLLNQQEQTNLDNNNSGVFSETEDLPF